METKMKTREISFSLNKLPMPEYHLGKAEGDRHWECTGPPNTIGSRLDAGGRQVCLSHVGDYRT
jgi:hypothetical protein